MPLIYHSQEKYSAFEESILNVVKYDNIKISCPYISLKLIRSWVSGKKDWKFLTDFHELVGNIPNSDRRDDFLDFFEKNQNNFRHIDMLHAKAIMSDENIFFGSANFTETGLTKRTELSCFSDNSELVQEINLWFDDLWEQAKISPKIDEIKSLVAICNQQNDIITEKIKHVKISSCFQPFSKKLQTDKNKQDKTEELPQNTEEKLEIILQKFNSTFINKFLDKSKELFDYLGLKPEDPRFRTSTPKNVRSLLSITIGKNRYALVAGHDSNVALMMPLDFENLISVSDSQKILNIQSFNNNKKGNPAEAKLVDFQDLDLSDQVFELWKKACKEEIDRNYTVKDREKDHNPYFYTAIIDPDYRDKILNQTH